MVALGCVIRGDTIHFEIVAQRVRARFDGYLDRARCADRQRHRHRQYGSEALARARPEEMDKGGDAARAALALVHLKRQLAGQ